MISKVTMLSWVGLRKLVMIMCWNAARPFLRKQCHGSPELSSSALNQSNLWTRATTHGKIWPPRSANTPHDFACGPLVSLFWLLHLPTGSTLFYILIIFSFVFSILPQFNNKPIIDNKLTELMTRQPDNGHIVEWDMSSPTGSSNSINQFSDTWHSVFSEHYRDS